MILHPSQKIVANDRHRFRVVNCGRRFGKTTLATIEMIGYAVAFDNVRIPYYAPTRDDARDIMWRMLCEEAADLIVDKNESRLELIIRNRFKRTSMLALYGWEAVQERRKGVGVKNKFIVLDEVAQYRNFKEGWNEVLRPTLTDLKGDAMFISTPRGFNHFYDLYNKRLEDTDYESFHFTTYDNPYISVEEIEKARKELTEDAFAQEYLADFRKHTGLIYKEFDRQIHVIDPIDLPSFWRFYRGMDFGAINPTACLWFAVDNDDNVYVFDEYYNSGQTSQFHAGVIKNRHKHEIIATYGDPSAQQEILDYASFEVYIVPATKVFTQDQDWVNSGIEKVSQYLKVNSQTGRPKLFIFKNCINLIRELELYHWIESRQKQTIKDMPEKIEDHAVDALRYFIVSFNPSNYSQYQPEIEIETNKYTGY